jgi:hypothetical protein
MNKKFLESVKRNVRGLMWFYGVISNLMIVGIMCLLKFYYENMKKYNCNMV